MVEIRLNQTQETIGAADSLVAGLEVEFRRWNNEVEVMGRDLKVCQTSTYSHLSAQSYKTK